MTKKWDERVYQAYQVFFEAMKQDSIHKLIRAASEFWGYDIVLTDENYYLISQHPNEKIGETVWDMLYEHRVVSHTLICDYQEMYLHDQQKTYPPFYADWGLIGDFPRIFAEIYTDDRILGHLGIFLLGNTPREEDLAIAQILVDALRIKMSRTSGYKPSLSTYLSDLLHNDSDAYLRSWATDTIKSCVTPSYVVMVTPVGESAAQKAFAEYAVNQVAKEFRNVVSTIYEGNIITLFGEMRKGSPGMEKEARFLQQAADYFTRIHAVNGVSDVFDDLLLIPHMYQQALLTGVLSEKPLAFYRNHAPAPLFLYVARNTDARSFIHPGLFELDKHDKENNTHFFETLRRYCFAMHNMDVAAKGLFIHRNTLAYRLKRINTLFGISLEDEQTARYLLSSFELWDVCFFD